MDTNAAVEAANLELETFASSANALGLRQARAIIAIGSLPGGYFRPGQSDLDLIVLFHGTPPADAAFSQAEREEMERLKKLAAQASPFEIELIFLHESRLARDPLTGCLPYADFVQRLRSQSKLLWGRVDLASLTAPEREDFVCAFKRYLEYEQDKLGMEFSQAWTQSPLAELLKHALVLMRTFLLVRRGILEYDKTRIARLYTENRPPAPLPQALARCIDLRFAGEPPSEALEAAARAELPAFHAALTKEILNLSRE